MVGGCRHGHEPCGRPTRSASRWARPWLANITHQRDAPTILVACVCGSLSLWCLVAARRSEAPAHRPPLAAHSSSRRLTSRHQPTPLLDFGSDAGVPPIDYSPCITADDCGASNGCRSGRCAPCHDSRDCATGELCISESCILATNASCTSDDDCLDSVRCATTSPEGGFRGNLAQRSFCLPYSGTTPNSPEESEPSTNIQSNSPLNSALNHALTHIE